jgi:hypothetical protein
MFVGHYGVAFGAKPATPPVPLWVYFIAVQWLDVVWSILVLFGVEKMHIVPGFTEANPYDLYYMPYTHGLPGAIVLSLLFGAVVAAFVPRRRAAVFLTMQPPPSRTGYLTLSCMCPICRSTTTATRSASGYGGTSRSVFLSRSSCLLQARGFLHARCRQHRDGDTSRSEASLHCWYWCKSMPISDRHRRPKPRWRSWRSSCISRSRLLPRGSSTSARCIELQRRTCCESGRDRWPQCVWLQQASA